MAGGQVHRFQCFLKRLPRKRWPFSFLSRPQRAYFFQHSSFMKEDCLRKVIKRSWASKRVKALGIRLLIFAGLALISFDLKAEIFPAGACRMIVDLPKAQWVASRVPSETLWRNTVMLRAAQKQNPDLSVPLFLLTSFTEFKGLVSSGNSKFRLIGPEKLAFTSQKLNEPVELLIQANDEADLALLHASQLDSDPTEVYQFSVKAKGRSTFGAIRKGSPDSELDSRRQVRAEAPEEQVRELMGRSEHFGQAIDEITFNHSHPFAEFLKLRPGEAPSAVLASLSTRDFEFARKNSLRFPGVRFVMKAVTPSGVNYSVTYLDGNILPLK
jgi:hypothetical protein